MNISARPLNIEFPVLVTEIVTVIQSPQQILPGDTPTSKQETQVIEDIKRSIAIGSAP
jgi:hypothetical protein